MDSKLGVACLGGALALATPQVAAAIELREFPGYWAMLNGFETPSDLESLTLEGGAGVDYGIGLAATDANNGWARGTSGWNAVTAWFPLPANVTTCSATVSVRVSGGLEHAYFSLIESSRRIVFENGPLRAADVGWGYVSYGIYARPTGTSSRTTYPWIDVRGQPRLGVRVGFWGNGQDNWLQVDDVELNCFHD